ncbi:MAG: S8 family serine peptidase [Anaerolineae bacterium]
MLLCLAVIVALSGAAGPAAAQPDKIAPELWAATADGQPASFLVLLAEQADLRPAGRLADPAGRRQSVYDALRQTALRSQKPLRTWLDQRGIPYKAHYLVNMLAVAGDRSLLLALARRGDVAALLPNPAVAGVEPMPAVELQPRAMTPGYPEWGVSFVRAPQVWNLFGVRGEGIVVGVQDTGVVWDHPALRASYRGWNGSTVNHAANWHSAVGATPQCPDPALPCDPYGHGTHVTGTITGDDGQGNQIGVAPGAAWIGCRNMDDQGRGSPSSYTECFEFFLAPWRSGSDPQIDGDPALGAHIVNNSWNCPPGEGCGHFTLQQVVENVRAAGVMVVASVGNNGSACGSVLYPIGTYDASYSVGSVDLGGVIAPSSSRGPVTYNGTGLSKPDISAPGVSIRSAFPPDRYVSLSGTSMAAPHVAGVVALLWSAYPSLIGQIDASEALLNGSAWRVVDGTCGPASSPDYNHTYGWGHVDALAALRAAAGPPRLYLPVIAHGG